MSTVPRYVIYGFHLGDHKIRYVGMTSDLERRLYDHERAADEEVRRPVYYWINKHGWSNVCVEELQVCQTVDELRQAEIDWISNLGTYVYDGLGGLNGTRGGDGVIGHVYTDDERAARAERQRAAWLDPAYRENMNKKLAVPRGPYSDERKKPWLEAGRAARVGCKRSPEYIAKHVQAVAAGRARNKWMKEMAYLDVPAEG